MVVYQVLTEQGKITQSVPPLPLSESQLDWLNSPNLIQTQFAFLQTLNMGFFECHLIQFDAVSNTAIHHLYQHDN